MPEIVQFFAFGRPAPQGSKNAVPIRNKAGRVVRINQVEQSPYIKQWREDVERHARAAMNGFLPIEGAVRISYDFAMPRTKGMGEISTPLHLDTPDIDKLIRGVNDALTGIVIADDRNIIGILAPTEKRYARPNELPGCTIRVVPDGVWDIHPGWTDAAQADLPPDPPKIGSVLCEMPPKTGGATPW